MHPFPVYIKAKDTFDGLLHCTHQLSEGVPCEEAPARWVYPDWNSHYHLGQALCRPHMDEFSDQVFTAGMPMADQLQELKTQLDTLTLEHKALLRTLAQDIYTEGQKNSLCHEGLMEFLNDHFAADLIPDFGKVFILYVSSTNPEEVEGRLDNLDSYFEEATQSYSLEIGDHLGDDFRSTLPELKRHIQRSWDSENVSW